MMFEIEGDINLDRSIDQEKDKSVQIDYEIIRSRRKTLAVHVTHEKVEVRAPLRASKKFIEKFINDHSAWVIKKLEQKSKHNTEALRIENGAAIFYAGKEKTIVFEECDHEEIIVDGLYFKIRGKNLNNKRAGKIFHRYLLSKAKHYLPERSLALAKYLLVEHKLREVVFRKTKTKWGHCTSAGRIQYNWLIMMAPNAIIDYIVVHEVCHLLYMNHSAKYWQKVESIIGDYKTYVHWLKEHEHRFWF